MSILKRSSPLGVRGSHIAFRPELDGIRGLAIIMVVFHHFNYAGYNYLGGRGFLGVDVFFALSGFLITRILLASRERGERIAAFYLRRVARLYPILLVSVVGISVYWRNNYHFLDRSPAVKSILYVKNFSAWGGVFGPLWSLSAEEQFYLVFPPVLFLGLKYFRKNGLTIVLALYASVIWTYALRLNSPQFNFNQGGVFNLVVFRPSVLIVGCLIAIHREWLESLVAKFCRLFLMFFCLLVWAAIHCQFPPLAGLATGALILLLSETVANNSSMAAVFRAALGCRVLAWIGLLSYSIYIWHLPLIFADTRHFSVRAISNMPLFFLELLAIACVSFYVIERPAMRLMIQGCNWLAKRHGWPLSGVKAQSQLHSLGKTPADCGPSYDP